MQPSPSRIHTPCWPQPASVTSGSFHQFHLPEPQDIKLRKSRHQLLPHQAVTSSIENLNFILVCCASRRTPRKILRSSPRARQHLHSNQRPSTTSQKKSWSHPTSATSKVTTKRRSSRHRVVIIMYLDIKLYTTFLDNLI